MLLCNSRSSLKTKLNQKLLNYLCDILISYLEFLYECRLFRPRRKLLCICSYCSKQQDDILISYNEFRHEWRLLEPMQKIISI